MTPSAVNCSTKYTVFSHALHFCCVPANAIAPSHTTAVVFFYLLRRTEEEEKKQEQKLKEEKPLQKQRCSAAAASFSTLPQRCCFPSQTQQKTEFGSNARERTKEKNPSPSPSIDAEEAPVQDYTV
jgi:hypothetical protein